MSPAKNILKNAFRHPKSTTENSQQKTENLLVPQRGRSETDFTCNISDIPRKLCGTPRHRCGPQRPAMPLFSTPIFLSALFVLSPK